MWLIKKILPVSICLLSACAAVPDSHEDAADTLQHPASNTPLTLPQKIIGSWSALAGEPDKVTMVINDTAFVYPESGISHRYALQGDSIKVDYTGFSQYFGVEFAGADTLKLTGGEDGPGVYKRVK